MHYIEARRSAYEDPQMVLEGCRSIVMLALPYSTAQDSESLTSQRQHRKIARYAVGMTDYHDVIHVRLKRLKSWLESTHEGALVRGVVDTAPLLEREFAEAAGLGWIGKNTLLLNRTWGSYFFLAALLTDIELEADAPNEKGYCGTCTACLDSCPTGAFPAPYVLDATRCISYLTIEHRDAIPEELAGKLSNWVFGCDVCQDVCPWNRKAEVSSEAVFEPQESLESFDVCKSLTMSDQDFRDTFRKTPLWRSKRRGIVRNAILCVVNQAIEEAYVLIPKLLDDPEPLIRGAAAWAIGKLKPANWKELLSNVQEQEGIEEVKSAILRAIND